MSRWNFLWFEWIHRCPAIFLLGLVYCYIIFVLLSFDHAWMQPEAFSQKAFVLYRMPQLEIADTWRGLNYTVFEHAARWTRPLSSYFEIVDTKFRAWLWQFLPPHPSLSLTWIFSLILSPVLLYKFLRSFRIDKNVALCAVCLYLLNPGFLSCVVMLFRPAKAMANFSIIFCLFLGSWLYHKYSKKPIAERNSLNAGGTVFGPDFALLIICMFVSFFWDETALLIYPAMLLFFPRLWRQPKRLAVYLCLPLLVLFFYVVLIPKMMGLAGYPVPFHFSDYPKMLMQSKTGTAFWTNFWPNSNALILESFGIVSIHPMAGWRVKIFLIGGLAGLTVLVFFLLRWFLGFFIHNRFQKILTAATCRWAGGLLMLLAVHNGFMTLTNGIWGLYWYGAYWPVFFIICLALVLDRAQIPRWLLMLCVGCIVLNLGSVFPETNRLYKKYHYYPFVPDQLSQIFAGKVRRFDPAIQPRFSGAEAQARLWRYWQAKKQFKSELPQPMALPKELFGLVIEMNPGKIIFRHQYLAETREDIYYLVQ